MVTKVLSSMCRIVDRLQCPESRGICFLPYRSYSDSSEYDEGEANAMLLLHQLKDGKFADQDFIHIEKFKERCVLVAYPLALLWLLMKKYSASKHRLET